MGTGLDADLFSYSVQTMIWASPLLTMPFTRAGPSEHLRRRMYNLKFQDMLLLPKACKKSSR